MQSTTAVPRSDVDLFSDAVMAAPYPVFQELRDAGPVVHLDKFDVFAIPRYQEARHVLGNWESFSSADVALNERFNAVLSSSILRADPPWHDTLRDILGAKLARRALRELEPEIARRAEEIVAPLVAQGSFDAVTDLARRFPVDVVGDLIGLPKDGREPLLGLIDANFNCFGPDNARTLAAERQQPELADYVTSLVARQGLAEGSMGRAVYDAAEAGQIPAEFAPRLIMTYVTAGMDTTVNAVGHAVWLLAQHPDQWDILRADPSLVPQAFREVLRCESPVQVFGRTARTDWSVGDVTVPAGSHLAVLFGSANRDERKWTNPDQFDIRRENIEHIAFGYGLHGCAGQALARIEGEAILHALLRNVSRIEAGKPVRHFNNVLRGLESLPVTVASTRGR
ncbi:MAG TPA: cytochrome P450 [Pseudonocardiaceae bacterium]|jgi:cytochrome P450